MFRRNTPPSEKKISDQEKKETFSLLGLILLLAVVLLTTVLVVFSAEFARFRKEKENELISIAASKVEDISSWRSERLADAKRVKSDPLVYTPIKEYIKDQNNHEREQEIYDWLENIRASNSYSSFFLVDQYGNILLQDLVHYQKLSSNEIPLIEEAYQNDQIVLSDLMLNIETQKGYLSLEIPISGKTTRPAAVVVLFIDAAQNLYPITQSWPVNTKTGELVLFRKEGNDLLFLNNLRFLNNSALQLRFPLDSSNIAAVSVLNGNFKPFFGTDYRGVPVMAVGRQIPETDWYLLAKEDRSEIFADITHEMWFIGSLFLVVLVLIFTLAFSQIRRQRQKLFTNLRISDLEKKLLQQKYGLLFDQSNDALFVISESGKILEANDRASQVYGYSHDELMKLNARDLILPSDREKFLPNLEKIKKQGGMHYERYALRKDKSAFPVEISSRYYEEDGHGYFLNYIYDLSEKRKNLEILQASEQKYRSLIEHSADGIVILDANGRLLDINDKVCQMLEYSASELLNQPISNLIDAENLKINPIQIDELLKDEKRSKVKERLLIKKDGSRLPVETLSYSLSGQRVQVVLRDISERVNYLKQLEDSAERYKLLFDANPISLYVYDSKTKHFLAVNDQALQQYGYMQDEFLTLGLDDIQLQPRLENVVDGTPAITKHVRKSGEVFDVETISHPIVFAEHQAVLERALNITQKLKAEKDLQENLYTLQSIIDTSPLAVITTDRKGIVTLSNRAAEKIFGWSPEEIVGKEYPLLDPGTGETVESIIHNIETLGKGTHYEAKRARKDGTIITADIYATPLLDNFDRPNGFLAIIADISDIKAVAEANQKLSEERDQLLRRLRLLFDRMPIGFILADKDLNVLDWNPQAEKIFGYTHDEMIGKNQFDLIIPPERYAEVKGVINNTENTNETSIYTHENITKGGRRIMVEWHDTSLYDENGNFIAIMNMAIDVTAKLEAERKIKETSEKLTAFFESPLVGMITATFDGRIFLANDEFLKIVGYSRDDLESGNLGWRKLTPPEFLPLDEAAIKEAKEKGSCTPYEKQYIRKDGHRIWVLIGFAPLRKGSDETVAYVQDISDRKRMEEALVESEANYRGLFTHMSNGMGFCKMIYEGDKPVDYLLLRVNEAFVKMTGFTNAIGKRASELLPDFYKSNPDIFETYGRVARFGEQANFETHIPQLGLYLSVFAYSPKKDYFVTLLEDITEQKRAELEIKNKQDLLNMTGRVGKIGGWEMDTITNTISWTETTAEINDLEPVTEPSLELAAKFFTPESRSKLNQALELAKATGKPYDLELSIVSEKGNHKIIRTIGIPEMENGKVVRIKGISQDITELKKNESEIMKLNEELEQRVKERTDELLVANKELESFSYSVSHDLRAPIRAIDGFSQIILDEYGAQVDPELLRYLEIIRQNTQNMGSLVDDLLAFSRLGRHPIQKTTVNMRQVVEDVVKNIELELTDRKVEFQIGDLPDCQADWTLIRQVYVNLISNAVKFTRKCDAPRIEIGYEKFTPSEKMILAKKPKYCYYVRDNGVGFDMRYYDKLFGVFQRLHKPEDYEGTGVGLAIVKRIIEKHGGAVWADSKLNGGTTFFFVVGENKANDKSN